MGERGDIWIKGIALSILLAIAVCSIKKELSGRVRKKQNKVVARSCNWI